MIGIVPARGGSKGIIGKNTATIGGVPLVLQAALTLREVCDRVLVSTDDDQIEACVAPWGFEVDRSLPYELVNDDATIDQRVAWYQDIFDEPLLILQPTVPGVTADDLRRLTAVSGDWVVAARPGAHIAYQDGQPITPRENRQAMPLHTELGVRFYRRKPTGPPTVVALDRMVVDVDSPGDLEEARRRFNHQPITFRVRLSHEIGSGHLNRCVLLARELPGYDIRFCFTDEHAAVPWPHCDQPEGVIVNDTLDTTAQEMAGLVQQGRVITLEDLGPGARLADYTINALYGEGELSGGKWADLRPEFAHLPAKDWDADGPVLVTFGGTDPSGLTAWAQYALDGLPVETLIPPLGGGTHVNVAARLLGASVVVTSAGRTVFEAARCGTPAVVVAQNARETLHTHLGPGHGNLFLGMAGQVSGTMLGDTVSTLLGSAARRRELGEMGQRSTDGLGARRIARLVQDVAEGLR